MEVSQGRPIAGLVEISGQDIFGLFGTATACMTSVRIQRSADPNFASIDETLVLSPSTTQYADSVANGSAATYYYRIAAANVAGTSGGGWNRGYRGGWRGNRWGGGWGWGPAVATGLAFGAVATAPYWDAGYYDYGYGYDCGPDVVTYGPWGGAYVSDLRWLKRLAKKP